MSLRVGAGEWLALLGPNGSGKSTLLKILTSSQRPDSGSVRILGTDLSGAPSVRERRRVFAATGVVFQHAGLDPLLTVRENLETQGSLYGLGRAEQRTTAAQAAADLGLSDRLDDRVASLSGGLMRRADLARALLHSPRLLLLDEPTTGLDLGARRAFLDTLAGLRRARLGRDEGEGRERGGLTIIMTTHLMDEAERADRVVMLDEGRMVADGPPAELRRRCGGRVLRCALPLASSAGPSADEIRSVLLAAGVTVTEDAHGHLTAQAGASALLEDALVQLSRLGAAFELAPPTLGDAYLAATGRALQTDDAEPVPVPAALAARRRERAR